MIRVCFAGVTGWTAPPILMAIDAADDLSLTCGVSRSAAGRTLAEATSSPGEGLIYASASEALQLTEVDVLVDYTSADSVKENVLTAIRTGVHAVVGSSGLTAEDYSEIDRLAHDRGVGVIAAGNFSIMAAVLKRAAALAARYLPSWEIVDYASAAKPDVPSGTSRELAEALAGVRTPQPAVPPSQLSGPVEARGADVGGTRIHSVRLPSFVVTTEIVFGGPGERLIMRHDPGESPDPYVAGTLLAIRRVADVPGVRRGLDSLLIEDH
jgi:4-hydroxy-tetrahydrodipicolinate reductase